MMLAAAAAACAFAPAARGAGAGGAACTDVGHDMDKCNVPGPYENCAWCPRQLASSVGCVPVGGDCNGDSDCCSDRCFSGRLPSDPKTCGAAGGGCCCDPDIAKAQGCGTAACGACWAGAAAAVAPPSTAAPPPAPPRYPMLPATHTADVSFSGELVWSGNETSSFALKKKRLDVAITSPYPLGRVTYYYDFAALTTWAYMASDPATGAPSCASSSYGYYDKWNLPDRPDALAAWNATAQGDGVWSFKTVFHSTRATESGTLTLSAADSTPLSLAFHIMGDPNPALETVTYSNYKPGVAAPASSFILPDVCNEGTARSRFQTGSAFRALALLGAHDGLGS